MRPLLIALVVTGIGLGSTPRLAAQACARPACRATNQLSVRVGTVLRLTLDGSPTVVTSASPSALRTGAVEAAGPTAMVRSNTRWRLHVSAASEVWTADRATRPDKPATDLTWTTGSAADYRALSTEPAVAAAGDGTQGTRVPFRFRTRLDPGVDPPGTYTLVVRYTLTTS
ncbi:MAG: hypothetical protein ACREMJ_12780 [Gemmatimonadales bacterium]